MNNLSALLLEARKREKFISELIGAEFADWTLRNARAQEEIRHSKRTLRQFARMNKLNPSVGHVKRFREAQIELDRAEAEFERSGKVVRAFGEVRI